MIIASPSRWRSGSCRPLLRRVVLSSLLLFGGAQLSGAALIQAKAWLAPVLIAQAWQHSRETGQLGNKPWPWADTWPVARLQIPDRAADYLVLAGDSGNALAFGPGHALASAPLGSPGLSMIGAHRDTHFAVLKDVEPGMPVLLELVDGTVARYTVTRTRVADSRTEMASYNAGSADEADTLLLVTCYPFDAWVAGGPLRYVVVAERDDSK